MLYKFVDKNYEKILKDRVITYMVPFIMLLAGFLILIIIGLLSVYKILKPFDIISGSFYALIQIFFIYELLYMKRLLKLINLYQVAKEIHIYDDRFEFITPAGLKMVAKFEWIGLIRGVEKAPYGLIFYYDEYLGRCNYLYMSKEVIGEIVKVYNEWVKRTGKKSCYILLGKASEKEWQYSQTILRRLEKSRFCKGARYLWR